MIFFVTTDSGTSEDSNYESMQIYEEIDSNKGSCGAISESSNELSTHDKCRGNLVQKLPPSILRPPDVSDMFQKCWNEVTFLRQTTEIKHNSTAPLDLQSSNMIPSYITSSSIFGVPPPSIIPRPKLAWPSRKVTFGKCIYIFLILCSHIHGYEHLGTTSIVESKKRLDMNYEIIVYAFKKV